MLEQYIVNHYLRAFIVLAGLLFLIRVGLSIATRISIKLSSKTKTDVDDKLVKKSSRPLTFLAFFVSIFVAVGEVPLEENVSIVLNHFISSFIVIVIAYLVYVVVNVLVISALKKAAKKTKSDIDDSLITIFKSILNSALIIIAILYILNLWGVEITPLLASLGIAGLAVALALQPVLSNIFSGAAMVLDHSVRVGDLVYLDSNTKGKIMHIGLRSTKIQTFDNELIIIPNSKLAESTIQNVALPEPKSRAVVSFGVAYGSDVDKVKKIILAELKKIAHVEKNPEPYVRFTEMADSALSFKAYFWVDNFENRFSAIDEANTRIYNALNKAKIEIPFPQVDVHVKK